MTFVRSQVACLVAGMSHLGESARQCAARRRLAMQEGEQMRLEAAAFHAAHVRGRGQWSATRRGGEGQLVASQRSQSQTQLGKLSGHQI